jgi:hypothetical protein
MLRLLARLRATIRNTVRFGKYLIRKPKVTNFQRKQVSFDIADPRLERYLYWLVKMFDIAGWGVAIRARPWLLLNLRNCSEYIYDIEGLRLTVRGQDDADVSITDRPGVKNAISVDTDYFAREKPEQSLNLPFFMHPDVYHTGLYKVLPELRKSEDRNIRVFLGGNLSSEYYDTPKIRERFCLMNRSEVTETAAKAMSASGNLLEIRRPGDAEMLLSGEVSRVGVLMREALLPLPQWMDMMSRSDFFVAPPGVLMPFSHNIIEAMAIGAVPITEYGHMFDPPLTDGETCLAFNNAEELKMRIVEAAAMEPSLVAELRQNVIDYYDSHLAPAAVVKKIYDRRDELERICLIAGHVSLKQNLARAE